MWARQLESELVAEYMGLNQETITLSSSNSDVSSAQVSKITPNMTPEMMMFDVFQIYPETFRMPSGIIGNVLEVVRTL